MSARFVALLFLICAPTAIYSMEGIGEGAGVSLDDLAVQGPIGETIPEKLSKFTNSERDRFIGHYGEDKYKQMRDEVGEQLFGLHHGQKRVFGNADLSLLVEQLTIANRLAQEKDAKDDANRAEDLARLRRLDCRSLLFGVIGGTVAGASALVSILVATHVIP